jgi:putative ABC transport system substrate-binding protein
MISRRALLTAATAGIILAAGPVVVAQPLAGVVRVGVLSAGNPRTAPQWVAFEQRLRELGYLDGQGFRLDFRDALGRAERMPELATELASLKPRVIVAGGPEATLKAVRQVAGPISVVMIAIDYDPIGRGHVAGLARPGGNVTGLFFRNLELTGKRLQLLTEVVPGLKDVAVFWDDFSADQLQAAQTAARSLGVRVHPLEMRNPPYDFESAFRALMQERPGALLGLASPLLFRERSRVADLALRHRLPAIFSVRQYAESGGLMSYGVSFRDMFRRAAEYVDRILKGAQPGDLPVEQPTRFELVINLRTAKALALAIPQSLLLRADHVVE